MICLLFSKPSSYGLLIGICLVLAGEGIRLLSAGYIVKNELLTTSGPYAYSRNPLYLGSFLIGLGLCFLSGLLHIFLPIYIFLFTLVYIPTIKSEEKFLTQRFGEAYLSYKRWVPAFFPLPKRKFPSSQMSFSWSRVKDNKETRSLLLSLLLIALFLLKYLLERG